MSTEKMPLNGIAAIEDTDAVIDGKVVRIPKGDPMDNLEFIDAFEEYLLKRYALGGPRLDRLNALARIGARTLRRDDEPS